MSSISGNQSPRFIPPQSAQPYTSLFGGDSSQDAPDLESYPLTQQGQGAAFDPNELDTIMEDGSLIEEDDFSDDDATYHDSGDDGLDLDSQLGLPTAEKKLDRKSGILTTTALEQPPSSPPSSPSYRPNRFRGPESTWRKLTAEDRRNAEALQDIRARDLAAHLYNAYALRVRAREIARRAAENNELPDATEAFAPPKRWALWPLPANEVPRGSEHFRRMEDEIWTWKMPSDLRPSAELEESLVAVMIRSAKERFYSRPWQERRRRSKQKDDPMSQGDTQDESKSMDLDVKSDPEPLDKPLLRPVIQADDDESRQQLRPLTRNVISQFDHILHSLHHARKGALGADDSSANEWQTDAESIVSGTSSPQKRKSNGPTDRSLSRGRKRTRRSPQASEFKTNRSRSTHQTTDRSASPGVFNSRGRSPGSKTPRSASRMRVGVRDWSQVLGVASMIGVSPAVVMRTAQRCAGLFREDMAFQTLKEGRLQQTQEDNTASWVYAESESEPPLPSPPPKTKRERSRPTSRAPSVKDAPKSQATSRATSQATSRATSPAHDNGEVTTEPKGKGPHRKNDIICPFNTCERHTNGFSRTWNLNLHLKRIHPGYRPRSTDTKRSASVRTEGEDAE